MHFEIFCQFLRDPNEFESFCVEFSLGKASSLKKTPKSQNLGLLKKVSFLFILYWKIQLFDQFLLLSEIKRSKLPSYYRKKSKI